MVVVTVLKNTGGFAMSYWAPPFAAREGLFSPVIVEFALTIGPRPLVGQLRWKEAEEADKKFRCMLV
jgi:hypothetical protein